MLGCLKKKSKRKRSIRDRWKQIKGEGDIKWCWWG